MESRISSTELARNLGDVLARVRYRGESFVVERNGKRIARVEPLPTELAPVRRALGAWRDAAAPDRTFADDLEAIGSDRPRICRPMGLVVDTSALVALERPQGNWETALASVGDEPCALQARRAHRAGAVDRLRQ